MTAIYKSYCTLTNDSILHPMRMMVNLQTNEISVIMPIGTTPSLSRLEEKDALPSLASDTYQYSHVKCVYKITSKCAGVPHASEEAQMAETPAVNLNCQFAMTACNVLPFGLLQAKDGTSAHKYWCADVPYLKKSKGHNVLSYLIANLEGIRALPPYFTKS